MTTDTGSTMRTAARRGGTRAPYLRAAGRLPSFAQGAGSEADEGESASPGRASRGHRARASLSPRPAKSVRGAPGPVVRRIARTVARLLQINRLGYDEARYVFRLAREAAGLARPKPGKKLPDYLPMEDVERLIAAAYRTNPANGLLIEVTFWAGLRVSEVARLRVEHLTLAEHQLKVVGGKGGKDRFAFLPPPVVEKLRLHVGTRDEGPVFCSRHGGAFTTRRIEQIVGQVARAAGLERRKVTPHALRRSIATALLNRGVPMEAVADLLGHADVKVTRDHYARLALPTLRKFYFEAVRGPGAAGARP